MKEKSAEKGCPSGERPLLTDNVLYTFSRPLRMIAKFMNPMMKT